MNDWEAKILKTLQLTDWKVEYTKDGYTWFDRKVIQSIPGDKALFLHECAHALIPPEEQPYGDKHNGRWASVYTNLVRQFMSGT